MGGTTFHKCMYVPAVPCRMGESLAFDCLNDCYYAVKDAMEEQDHTRFLGK